MEGKYRIEKLKYTTTVNNTKASATAVDFVWYLRQKSEYKYASSINMTSVSLITIFSNFFDAARVYSACESIIKRQIPLSTYHARNKTFIYSKPVKEQLHYLH
jgi:hypothetical protein